jgi:hypothetical protein
MLSCFSAVFQKLCLSLASISTICGPPGAAIDTSTPGTSFYGSREFMKIGSTRKTCSDGANVQLPPLPWRCLPLALILPLIRRVLPWITTTISSPIDALGQTDGTYNHAAGAQFQWPIFSSMPIVQDKKTPNSHYPQSAGCPLRRSRSIEYTCDAGTFEMIAA